MFDINSKADYQMNTFGIKPFANYDEALAHYNSVAPIRGKTVRPLGVRRHHGSASISLDGTTGDVQLNYLGQPFVVWHNAGGFTLNAPYHYSGFIAHTLHNYLPNPMFFQWDKGRLIVRLSDVGKSIVLDKRGSLKFIMTETGYDLESYPKEYNYRKRPRITKKIVAKYQPFIDWVALVMSIDNKANDFERETESAHDKLRAACGFKPSAWYDEQYRKHYSNLSYDDPFRKEFNYDLTVLDELPLPRKHRYGKHWSHKQSAERLLEWISGTEPTEDWSWAMYVLLRQGGAHEHIYGKNPTYVRFFRGDDLTTYIEELICVVYADEVFIKEQLEEGVVPSKSNRHYVTEPALSEQSESNSISS